MTTHVKEGQYGCPLVTEAEIRLAGAAIHEASRRILDAGACENLAYAALAAVRDAHRTEKRGGKV